MSASTNNFQQSEINPLKSLDVWEDDVLERYPDPTSIASDKSTEAYRNYENPERDTVREFYRLNHTYQSYDFVLEKKGKVIGLEVKSGATQKASGMEAFQREHKPNKILLVGSSGLPWHEFLKISPGQLF